MYPPEYNDGDDQSLKLAAAQSLANTKSLRADAAQNRQAVLEAADRLFAERGFGVTMSEIALAAGVGRATLHRNFSTRLEIAFALFDRNLQEFRAVAAAQTGQPGDFEALLDLKLGYYVRNGGLAEAIQVANVGDFSDSRREIAQALAQAAQASRDQSGLRDGIDPELCEILQMMMSGVLLSGGNLEQRAARAARLRSVLLNGLLQRPA